MGVESDDPIAANSSSVKYVVRGGSVASVASLEGGGTAKSTAYSPGQREWSDSKVRRL